jgi:nucleoside-diphosphate-sugar epimerase
MSIVLTAAAGNVGSKLTARLLDTGTEVTLIGRPVKHVAVSPDPAREALVRMGISEDLARQYVELYQAFDSGHITRGLPQEPGARGATTFEHFARETILPTL